jgi:hypothetical protein
MRVVPLLLVMGLFACNETSPFTRGDNSNNENTINATTPDGGGVPQDDDLWPPNV